MMWGLMSAFVLAQMALWSGHKMTDMGTSTEFARRDLPALDKCLQDIHVKRKTGREQVDAPPPQNGMWQIGFAGRMLMACGEEMIKSTNKVPIISDDDTEIRNEQGNVLLFALITMATVEDAAAVVRDKQWGDRTVTPQYMTDFYLGVSEQTKTDFTKRCMEAMQDRLRSNINWKDDEAQAMRNDPKGGTNFYNMYGGAPYVKGGTFSSRGGLPALPPMPREGGQCDCAGSWLPQFGQVHEWSPIKRLEGNTCQGWMCSRAVHAGGTEDRPVCMRLPSAPYAQEKRATGPPATDSPGTDPWRTTSTFGTPDPPPAKAKRGAGSHQGWSSSGCRTEATK